MDSESISVKSSKSNFPRLFPALPSAIKEQQKLRHHLLQTRSCKETTRSSRQIPPPLWTLQKSSSMRHYDYITKIKHEADLSLDDDNKEKAANDCLRNRHEDTEESEKCISTAKTNEQNLAYENSNSRCKPGEDSEMSRRLWLRRWLTSGEIERKSQSHRQNQSAETAFNDSAKEMTMSSFSVDLAVSIINVEDQLDAEKWIYESIQSALEPTDRVLLLASIVKKGELQLRFAVVPTTQNKSSVTNNWRRVGLALFRLFGGLAQKNRNKTVSRLGIESPSLYHLNRFHIASNNMERSKDAF